jgi:hypothetical protein
MVVRNPRAPDLRQEGREWQERDEPCQPRQRHHRGLAKNALIIAIKRP